MNNNFTSNPCSFNAVLNGQMCFVTEGHFFTPLQLTALETLY